MENSIYQALPAPGLLADLLLVFHSAIVAFVILGQILFMIGGVRGWCWVRNLWLRLVHLGTIAFVTIQAWLGELCPLTIWEYELRRADGQDVTEMSFVEYWVGQALYHDLPGWVFIAAYTTFAALVAFTWWWIPPRRAGQERAS